MSLNESPVNALNPYWRDEIVCLHIQKTWLEIFKNTVFRFIVLYVLYSLFLFVSVFIHLSNFWNFALSLDP